MTWENKTQMCKLANQGKRKEFNEFVLNHIESFDDQAWDMFITATEIIIEQINEDKDFWKKFIHIFLI